MSLASAASPLCTPNNQCGCEAPDGGQYRYGVFLRPSAALVSDSLRAYAVTEHVYGYRSANAYPPHITLVGSIAPSVGEDQIVDAVAGALAGRGPVRLTSPGMRLLNGSVDYRFTDADPDQLAPGARVADLMGAVLGAVAGLRHFHDEDRTAAKRRLDSPERFSPHLSIISFDGPQSPELTAEALDLLLSMGLGGPVVDTFDRVHLLRLHSFDWSSTYWDSLTWTVVKTWRLGDTHE